MAYVGQHSKANVRGGIMAHSYSSLGIQNMLLNGKPVGEIDIIAAMAGQFHSAVSCDGSGDIADRVHHSKLSRRGFGIGFRGPGA